MTRKTRPRGQNGYSAFRRTRVESEVRIVHSSDLHVDDDYTARIHGGDGTAGLRGVLDTARHLAADLVVLAGDVFENNRLPHDVLGRAADLLAAFAKPIVILPGNHDPAVADSAHQRGGLGDIANVAVLGITHAKAARFPALDLEIWGRAHRDYDDMAPLAMKRARRTRWQIAVAHGHYEPRPDLTTPYRPSWLISADEIAATGADYVALGHWNRPARVSRGPVKAYYSGCPEIAGTVNLVRLTRTGDTLVARRSLRWR
jgi:DNA repair exonuclease SbcCD nuclease subunit